MKIKRPVTFNIQDTEHKRFVEDLFKLTLRNISFGTFVDGEDQNIAGKMIEIADSGVANSSITLTHNLGYVPKFYDVKYMSLATQVFDFGTAWTKTQIFLASSTAHTKLRVFVH
jgi:hypothetical protein